MLFQGEKEGRKQARGSCKKYVTRREGGGKNLTKYDRGRGCDITPQTNLLKLHIFDRTVFSCPWTDFLFQLVILTSGSHQC